MTLKKALSLGSLAMMMGLSSQSFAANLSCTVEFTYATKIGLMPLSKKKDLPTTRIETKSTEDSYCPSLNAYGLVMSICAAEDTEAQGIVHAVVKVDAPTYEIITEADFSEGTAALAMPKKAGAPLVFVDKTHIISPVLVKSLMNAKMDIPTYENGDSASMDKSVEEAVAKGVIEEGLITSVSFSECRLK